MARGPGLPLKTVAAWVARTVVGLAFVIAGTTKAVHPGAFIADIWTYRLIPEDTAYFVAVFLPWVEIVVGAALIARRQIAGARVLAAVLLVVFLAAILVAWTSGLDIACGCFGAGAGGPASYPWLVARDLLLIGCLACDAVIARRRDRQEAAAVPR